MYYQNTIQESGNDISNLKLSLNKIQGLFEITWGRCPRNIKDVPLMLIKKHIARGKKMKETMKALEKALEAIFQMKAPSLEKILKNQGFVYEAGRVRELMTAYEKEYKDGIALDDTQSYYETDIDSILKEAEEKANEVWMRVRMKRALRLHGLSLPKLNAMETKDLTKLYSKLIQKEI